MADCLGWVLPVHKAQSSARSARLSRKALTSSSSSVICSILRRRQFWAAIWKIESETIVFVEVMQERNSTSFSAKSRFCKVSGKEYVWTCRPCFCLFSEYRDIGWSAVPSVAWQLFTLPHNQKSQEMDSVQVYQVLSISPNSSMELEMMLETEKGSRRLKAALSSRVNLCGTGLSWWQTWWGSEICETMLRVKKPTSSSLQPGSTFRSLYGISLVTIRGLCCCCVGCCWYEPQSSWSGPG